MSKQRNFKKILNAIDTSNNPVEFSKKIGGFFCDAKVVALLALTFHARAFLVLTEQQKNFLEVVLLYDEYSENGNEGNNYNPVIFDEYTAVLFAKVYAHHEVAFNFFFNEDEI